MFHDSKGLALAGQYYKDLMLKDGTVFLTPAQKELMARWFKLTPTQIQNLTSNIRRKLGISLVGQEICIDGIPPNSDKSIIRKKNSHLPICPDRAQIRYNRVFSVFLEQFPQELLGSILILFQPGPEAQIRTLSIEKVWKSKLLCNKVPTNLIGSDLSQTKSTRFQEGNLVIDLMVRSWTTNYYSDYLLEVQILDPQGQLVASLKAPVQVRTHCIPQQKAPKELIGSALTGSARFKDTDGADMPHLKCSLESGPLYLFQ